MENEKTTIEWLQSHGTLNNDVNQNLVDALVWGEEEKLLSQEDCEKLIGNTIWLRYQPLITRHWWHIDYQEPVYRKIDGISSLWSLSTIELESEWPSISADQKELYDILHELWYLLEHRWRSGFASRNSYLVCKKYPKKQKVKAPLVTQWWLEKENKIKFWLEWNRVSSDNYIVWTWKLYEWEIILESEKKEAEDAIKHAKQELANRRKQRLINEINQNKQWNISIISVWWWPESFSRWELPENYEVLSEKRIACTADHRRNRTHTYELVIIDKNLFVNKSFAKIKVPDQYKGIVIGKWWSKIKELCQKFGCKIKVV